MVVYFIITFYFVLFNANVFKKLMGYLDFLDIIFVIIIKFAINKNQLFS